jgi:hypothetical protein
MRTVVMHVDQAGVVWAIAKCRVCGEVHKYLVADAIAGDAHCRSCKRPMEMQGAVIAAAHANERQKPDGADAPASGS